MGRVGGPGEFKFKLHDPGTPLAVSKPSSCILMYLFKLPVCAHASPTAGCHIPHGTGTYRLAVLPESTCRRSCGKTLDTFPRTYSP